MTNIPKQAKTLLVIAASSPKLGVRARSLISDELREMMNVAGLQPARRRRLLSAIHVARSLETTLKEVINFHAIQVADRHKNMGGYLSALAAQTIIPQKIQINCSNQVRILRNRIAHGAGEYPTGEQQLNSAAMAAHACMTLIL